MAMPSSTNTTLGPTPTSNPSAVFSALQRVLVHEEHGVAVSGALSAGHTMRRRYCNSPQPCRLAIAPPRRIGHQLRNRTLVMLGKTSTATAFPFNVLAVGTFATNLLRADLEFRSRSALLSAEAGTEMAVDSATTSATKSERTVGTCMVAPLEYGGIPSSNCATESRFPQ